MTAAAEALERYEAHRREPVHMGRMADPDGIGNVGSIVVGRALRFFVRVAEGRIAEARFQVFACGDAVPSASRLCELVVGRTPVEALTLSHADLRTAFGDLEVDQLPVVSWALVAMRLAVSAAQGDDPPMVEDDQHPGLVCRCFGIDEATLQETIAELDQPELEDLIAATGAGSGCGSCQRDLAALLEASRAPEPAPTPGGSGGKGRVALLKRIAATAEPLLAEAGGTLELWTLEGASVILRARGTVDDALVTRLEMTLRDEVDPTLAIRVDR